ncbi:MAG: hypothetical protein A2W29_10775 [Gemmatimonadetes bacterium RBG_16_66_8]|nr:MAG: hypothetical protein A2W29_10775 [Gemmatimonadetes bacterium RBG_16_66_8]
MDGEEVIAIVGIIDVHRIKLHQYGNFPLAISLAIMRKVAATLSREPVFAAPFSKSSTCAFPFRECSSRPECSLCTKRIPLSAELMPPTTTRSSVPSRTTHPFRENQD